MGFYRCISSNGSNGSRVCFGDVCFLVTLSSIVFLSPHIHCTNPGRLFALGKPDTLHVLRASVDTCNNLGRHSTDSQMYFDGCGRRSRLSSRSGKRNENVTQYGPDYQSKKENSNIKSAFVTGQLK